MTAAEGIGSWGWIDGMYRASIRYASSALSSGRRASNAACTNISCSRFMYGIMYKVGKGIVGWKSHWDDPLLQR